MYFGPGAAGLAVPVKEVGSSYPSISLILQHARRIVPAMRPATISPRSSTKTVSLLLGVSHAAGQWGFSPECGSNTSISAAACRRAVLHDGCEATGSAGRWVFPARNVSNVVPGVSPHPVRYIHWNC